MWHNATVFDCIWFLAVIFCIYFRKSVENCFPFSLIQNFYVDFFLVFKRQTWCHFKLIEVSYTAEKYLNFLDNQKYFLLTWFVCTQNSWEIKYRMLLTCSRNTGKWSSFIARTTSYLKYYYFFFYVHKILTIILDFLCISRYFNGENKN